MIYLVADKILRSTKIKFEVAQSELSLLLKSNIMHLRNIVVSIYGVLIIIRQLKSIYLFTRQFICLPYMLEKGEKLSMKFTYQKSIDVI